MKQHCCPLTEVQRIRPKYPIEQDNLFYRYKRATALFGATHLASTSNYKLQSKFLSKFQFNNNFNHHFKPLFKHPFKLIFTTVSCSSCMYIAKFSMDLRSPPAAPYTIVWHIAIQYIVYTTYFVL